MDYLFQFLISVFWELWPFKVIRPWERGLLIVLGGGDEDTGLSYHTWGGVPHTMNRLLDMSPGIHARVPLIMDWESMGIKEEPCDLPHQVLTCSDGTTLGISGRLTYRTVDMRSMWLQIDDHEEWLTTIAMGHLSEWVMNATWDELDADDIAEDLLPKLQADAAEKGMDVVRLEITHLAMLDPSYHIHDGIGSALFD